MTSVAKGYVKKAGVRPYEGFEYIGTKDLKTVLQSGFEKPSVTLRGHARIDGFSVACGTDVGISTVEYDAKADMHVDIRYRFANPDYYKCHLEDAGCDAFLRMQDGAKCLLVACHGIVKCEYGDTDVSIPTP